MRRRFLLSPDSTNGIVTKSVLIDARVDMLAVAVTLVLPKTEVAMKPLALFGGRSGAAVAIEDRQPAGRVAGRWSHCT